MGIPGCYGESIPPAVREYKAKYPRRLGSREARSIARRPLQGFVTLLAQAGVAAATVEAWIDEIVEKCVAWSSTGDGEVRKSKRFDDPIDSGIAFLTAVACSLDLWHAWGDGSDGAIVGPGKLPP